VLRLSMPDIHPSDSLAHVKESFDRMVAGEISLAPDIPVKRKDGSVFHADVSAAAITLGGRNLLMGVFRDTTERGRAEGEARRHAELQAAINEMLRVSLEDLPLDSILEKSLGIITAIPWLVLDLRGSIHLVEDDPEVLVVKAQRGLANSLLVMCDRVPFGRCLCGRAASTRQLVFADHVDDSHENQYDGIHDHGHYCVPMLSADQRVLGVLNLYFAAGGRRNKETEELLGVVANVLAGVVQRKRAEEDVKLKAELLDAGTDSIFLHDPAGRFLYANESSYRTRGYTKEEFLALNLHDLDVPEYAARIEPRIAEMLRTGAATFESAQFRRDRSVIPVEVHARMLKVGGRELILSVVRDITERKRTETELRESELKFRAIFDNASEGMFLVDQDSRKFVLANGSCLRMLGYSAEEFANLSIADIHPEEDLHFVFEQIGVFMKGETGKRGDVRFKRKDGSLFPADTSPGAIMLGDKKCILIVFSDITERKHAEAELVKYRDHLEELVHARTGELEQSNKELETFSYSVSHDLRAPLRAINGFAQALQEDCSAQLDPVGLDYLDRVRAASRSMAELIDNLLTLARSSRLPLERKPVNLSELARTIAGELHSAEPARKVELVIPDSMTAQADPVLAEMVLRNLLSNAWKFTGKHPTARIEVGETVRDGEPVWFVRDDGAGFDMAYVGNLSKPFQRLHGPADFPGTGIGLVTVQRLVLRHGGRGWIEGAVEKGATFYFTFQTATREA
ncbi:MAG: PAS domain S-box protein, partial [candidate division WOR-3 bacterium]|nr:PAS domain S-box protein [candidate division WOR-3 bacterium]